MEQVHENTPTIDLTDAAVRRVNQLIEERNLPDHALRVFVSRGGCSGYQYGMTLESDPHENDLRFPFGEIEIVVDPMSMSYLSGSTIDYVDDLMGGGFQINNPNAIASCGCGQSFRSKQGDAPAAAGAGCGCS